MWQDRAGYLRAFSGYQTIKKVPKERGTRSNAGLGAQDILFSSSSFDLFRFVCLADMSRLTICHDYTLQSFSR